MKARIALVTGVVGGIGAAIAARLATEGAHVIVSDLPVDHTVVRHFSSVDSEWFKVPDAKYATFIDKIERLVLRRSPQPVAFFILSDNTRTRYGKLYRTINIKRTREELRKLDSVRTQRKRKKQTRESTKGSTDYWTKKIVGKKIDADRTVAKVTHLKDSTYYVDYTDSTDAHFEKRVPIDVFLDMLTDDQLDEWGIRSNLEWYNIQRYGD